MLNCRALRSWWLVGGFSSASLGGFAVAQISTEAWPTTPVQATAWFLQRQEPLYLEDFRPAGVDPAQDFFADPLWQNDQVDLFSAGAKQRLRELDEKVRPAREQEGLPAPELAAHILAQLAPYSDTLAKLQELGQRSGANPGWDYARGYDARQPHLEALMLAGRALRLRAEALLASQEPDRAAADARLIFRLARSVLDEPQLLSLLVAVNLQEMGRCVVWSGRENWHEGQRTALVGELREARPSRRLADALRGERGAFNHQRREIGRLQYPAIARAAEEAGRHFLDAEHLFYNLAMQIWIDALEQSGGALTPKVLQQTREAIELLRAKQAAAGQGKGASPQGQFPVVAGLIARVLEYELGQVETADLLENHRPVAAVRPARSP